MKEYIVSLVFERKYKNGRVTTTNYLLDVGANSTSDALECALEDIGEKFKNKNELLLSTVEEKVLYL